MIEFQQNQAEHYARTLFLWRHELEKKWAEARTQGFTEEQLRAWRYYFSYCEAGFSLRALGLFQMVLMRPERPGFLDPEDIETPQISESPFFVPVASS